MRLVACIAGLIGLGVLVALLVHFNAHDIVRVNALAGWRLLWLAPYRALYFLLYAVGWYVLLRALLPHQSTLGFGSLLWITGVREAIDRLLPVASVGGAFIGVSLAGQRGLGKIAVSASIVAEILLTLWASYLFAVLGFALAAVSIDGAFELRRLWLPLLCTLPVPIACLFLLRRGRLFLRLQRILAGFVGVDRLSGSAQELDRELHCLMRQSGPLVLAATLQFSALLSGAVEVWLALHWFGTPIGFAPAVILESASQALRHLAFFVPGALGVQEAGLIGFGMILGISPELALALSIAKRMREIVCGIPFLISWQWHEWLLLRPTHRLRLDP